MTNYVQHIKDLEAIQLEAERMVQEKPVYWQDVMRALNYRRWHIGLHFQEKHPYQGEHKKTWDVFLEREDKVAQYLAPYI